MPVREPLARAASEGKTVRPTISSENLGENYGENNGNPVIRHFKRRGYTPIQIHLPTMRAVRDENQYVLNQVDIQRDSQ